MSCCGRGGRCGSQSQTATCRLPSTLGRHLTTIQHAPPATPTTTILPSVGHPHPHRDAAWTSHGTPGACGLHTGRLLVHLSTYISEVIRRTVNTRMSLKDALSLAAVLRHG